MEIYTHMDTVHWTGTDVTCMQVDDTNTTMSIILASPSHVQITRVVWSSRMESTSLDTTRQCR